MNEYAFEQRFFVTYRGVKPPSKMVEPIEENALKNRNTYIRALYDQTGQLRGFDKMVYGEVELAHRYDYSASGALVRATIAMADEEPVTMRFEATPP